MIMGVKYVQIFGTGIKMGDFATLITSPDAHIHLTTWISGGYEGKITVGDFCLIVESIFFDRSEFSFFKFSTISSTVFPLKILLQN